MSTLETLLSIHRTEILRWNRQFNLISRTDPLKEVNTLLDESVAAYHCLEEYIKSENLGIGSGGPLPINYFDLGSGGGFPGLIWNAMFSASKALAPHFNGGHLIEPREKRAWFLDLCVRKQEQVNLWVHRVRWGDWKDSSLAPSSPMFNIISLKALHMEDSDVMGGLAGILDSPSPENRVLVLRFSNPGGEHHGGIQLPFSTKIADYTLIASHPR